MVVAGVESGTGKTTVALGLVGALRRRGRSVQTFKVGPDFVDCAYLAHASRRPCRNLDSWMLGRDGVVDSFANGVREADCAIVEGTMGIFDGHGRGAPLPAQGAALTARNSARADQAAAADAAIAQQVAAATELRGTPMTRRTPAPGARSLSTAPPAHTATPADRSPGSTAELARLIHSPVILVIDVGNSAETAAAIALGVRHLDPDLDLIGVILNNVPTDYRRRVAEDAIWNWATLPVLGALPHLEHVEIPEIRSGLLPVTQNPDVDPALEELTAAVERYCDIALIERLMHRARPVQASDPPHKRPPAADPVRVAVAFDDAFCFYYAENLELLEEAGAEVITFSPLEDRALPRDIDAVYMGGGVSEMFVPRLAANQAIINSMRRAHAHQLPIYAECGGLLYCARSLHTSDGRVHAMAGLLPLDVAFEPGLCHTGYRELRIAGDSILGAAGTPLRGHEFHFARLLAGAEAGAHAYSVHDVEGEPLGCEGWSTPTLLASLVHVHFGQDPTLAHRFVAAAREGQQRRRLQAASA